MLVLEASPCKYGVTALTMIMKTWNWRHGKRSKSDQGHWATTHRNFSYGHGQNGRLITEFRGQILGKPF